MNCFTLSQPTARVQLVPSAQAEKLNYFIRSAEDVDQLLGAEMRQLDREYFLVIYLNNRQKVIDIETIAIGTVDELVLTAREVFKGAMLVNASAIVLVHNHPSGICQPSYTDKKMTRYLVIVGKIHNIPVQDHIIFGESYFSFHAAGMLRINLEI